MELFVGTYSFRRNNKAIYIATIRTGIVGAFFERLAGVALLLTQAEIGIGFLYVLTQTREKLQTMVRFAAFAMAGLLFILSIASLGKTLSAWTLYFGYRYGSSSDSAYDSFVENLNVGAKLSGAVEILFWLTCLPVLAFAAFVMHKVKSYPMLRNVSLTSPPFPKRIVLVALPRSPLLTRINSPGSSCSSPPSSTSSDTRGTSPMRRHGFCPMMQTTCLMP